MQKPEHRPVFKVGEEIQVRAGWLKPRDKGDALCVLWGTGRFGYLPEEPGDEQIRTGKITRTAAFLGARVLFHVLIDGVQYSVGAEMIENEPSCKIELWSYWEDDIDQRAWSWSCQCGGGGYPYLTAQQAALCVVEHLRPV